MKSIVLGMIVFSLLAGCAVRPVEAWQRDVLAKPEMSFDADPLAARVTAQVYQSKEAASGGSSAGGGGCGCN